MVPLVLTTENIHNYTIKDVVYPMPGRRTVYPDNDIGELIKDMMSKRTKGIIIIIN
jgi:tRNA pseudouridine13 synthase